MDFKALLDKWVLSARGAVAAGIAAALAFLSQTEACDVQGILANLSDDVNVEEVE